MNVLCSQRWDRARSTPDRAEQSWPVRYFFFARPRLQRTSAHAHAHAHAHTPTIKVACHYQASLPCVASFLHCLKRQILNPLLFAVFPLPKPPLSLWSTSTPFFLSRRLFGFFSFLTPSPFSIPQPSSASPIHLDLPRSPNP